MPYRQYLMPKLYQVFVASNLIVPLIVSTSFFVAFLLSFEMFRIVTLMSADDTSFTFLFRLIGSVAMTLIPMAIPLSMFFSTIYTVNKMSSDSEYVAMRAAGLTKLKILLPLIIVGLCVAFNVYYFNQKLVPSAHRSVRKKIKILSSKSLIQGIKSGQFFTSIQNITMFPEKMNEETLNIEKVFLHIFDENTEQNRVIWARSGKLLHEKNEETGIESFKIRLNDGNIATFNSKENSVEKVLFSEYVLPISEQRFDYRPSTKEIMMSKGELEELIRGGVEKAQKLGFKKKLYFNAKYEYWNRFNTPILVILLCFLGFTIGVKDNRGKSANSNAIAIGYLILYYVIFFTLVNFARSNQLNIIVALIIPNLIIFIIALRKYRKMDWHS